MSVVFTAVNGFQLVLRKAQNGTLELASEDVLG